MDRRKRPFDARRRLAACLLLPLLIAGCGGNSNVQLSSGGAPGVPGGSTVSTQGPSTLGALIAAGLLIGSSIRSERNLAPSTRAPDLDPSRRVVERDCTRPIEDWSANLRCR